MSLRYTSLAISMIAICWGGPACAGTHFVASTGTDSAACTRAAPCSTISQAVTNASPNDTVFCLDGVVGSALGIIKSIDIECSGARAVFRDTFTQASIVINIPVSSNDPFRTVRLRGISTLGANSTARISGRGIEIISAAAVFIEDVVVSEAQLQGIFDHRTGGQTKLFVTDSIIRNNGGAGIVAAASEPGIVVLNNVSSQNNAYGIAVAAGNNVLVNRSVLSGNSVAGIEADGGAQVVVNNSAMSHNTIGVQSASSIRLSNNDIAFNATALSGSSGTFGNNRFSGNGTPGTPPVALGGASSDLGQQ